MRKLVVISLSFFTVTVGILLIVGCNGKTVTEGNEVTLRTQADHTLVTPTPSEEREYVAAGNHPITHDQLYMVPSDVAKGDYIGKVHYLCTDSVFNNHSPDGYRWSIVYGNTGDAFVIDSETGLLTVNNVLAVAGDFTIGVQIVNGRDADTAICTIIYRKNCIYVDRDKTRGGRGSRAHPYGLAYDYGKVTGGQTVLFKRGSSGIARHRKIYNNTGEYLVFGAYGKGAKPVFENYTGKGGMVAFSVGDDWSDDENHTGDSIIFMDMKFYCEKVSDYDHNQAILLHNDCNDNLLYRLHTVNHGVNGAIYIKNDLGEDTYNFLSDIRGDSTVDDRVCKSEAMGTVFENIYGFHNLGAFLMFGGTGTGSSNITAKYLYTESSRYEVSGNYPFDFRDSNTLVEWAVAKDWEYAVYLQEVDLYPEGTWTYPSIIHDTIRNAIFINTDKQSVLTYISQPYVNDPIEDFHFENVLIINSGDRGFSFTADIIDMYVKNCIVVGSADDGIYADSDVDGLVVENSIFYNNGGYDINISSASGDLMRNVLYNTMNGSSAGSSNYNISASGDPFADGTNGDYRSNVRKETINTGTDIGQEHDILGNTIRVQDIGAFEYGGTKFNWTQR